MNAPDNTNHTLVVADGTLPEDVQLSVTGNVSTSSHVRRHLSSGAVDHARTRTLYHMRLHP
jgi:hypothetical protein